jgi:hypothetical protein
LSDSTQSSKKKVFMQDSRMTERVPRCSRPSTSMYGGHKHPLKAKHTNELIIYCQYDQLMGK